MSESIEITKDFWYYLICEEIELNTDWTFLRDSDRTISIVLVSDYQVGHAAGLAYYLNHFVDVNACLVTSEQDWEKYVKLWEIVPDFIIYVAICKNKKLYQLCDRARERNNKVISILFDIIYSTTIVDRGKYHIDECFELYLPTFIQIDFLRTKYVEKNSGNLMCPKGRKMTERIIPFGPSSEEEIISIKQAQERYLKEKHSVSHES